MLGSLVSRKASAEEAAALWASLFDGRGAVEECTESDGVRTLVVRQPPPWKAPARKLSPAERAIVAVAAQGKSLKAAAEDLGCSASRVSHRLHSALRKLGVRSRTDLIRWFGSGPEGALEIPPPPGLDVEILEAGTGAALRFSWPVQSPPELACTPTRAEQQVLQAIARGASNSEIARARGTSPRTVANQVQSLLEKFGAGSRYELVARMSPGPGPSRRTVPG